MTESIKKPTSFFKFVAKARVDILENGLIRFSPAKDFNDPFELNPMLTHLTKCWVDYAKSLDRRDEIEFSTEEHDYSSQRFHQLASYRDKISGFSRENGILSLSGSFDTSDNPSIIIGHEGDPRNNLLMWAHYCANHTGFVIELSDGFVDGDVVEVIYGDDRPIIYFEDVEAGVTEFYKYKSSDWSYENEWRIIKPLTDADEKEWFLFKFDRRKIKSITLGCRASPDLLDKLKLMITSIDELSHVELYCAKTHELGFQLDFFQHSRFNGRWFTNDAGVFSFFSSSQKIPGTY